MSSTSTPTDSPVIQPMHNPAQAAVVQQPKPPLGNSTNGSLYAPRQGFKAMMFKKLGSKGGNPKYISPTDKMLTPCTAKISESKKKHFNKGKPIQLFRKADPAPEPTEESPSTETVEEEDHTKEKQPKPDAMVVDDENPF